MTTLGVLVAGLLLLAGCSLWEGDAGSIAGSTVRVNCRAAHVGDTRTTVTCPK